MRPFLLFLLFASSFMLGVNLATAHNSVVVVPLGGGGKTENVITVAKSGGNYNSIIAAVASVSDASESKPYVIYIAPGVYDLGADQLVMKPYVSIIGSGEGVTILKSSRSNTIIYFAVVIRSADNTHLSNFTLSQTAAGSYAIAIGNFGTSPSISNVEIIQKGFSATTIGIYSISGASPLIDSTSIAIQATNENVGIYSSGSNPVMNDVAVNVLQGGTLNIAIRLDSGAAIMNNVHATAQTSNTNADNYGLFCLGTGNQSYINSSSFKADGNAINSYGMKINSGSTAVRVVNSRIIGGVDDDAPGVQCRGIYDSNLANIGC